jgi:hypothetical protein
MSENINPHNYIAIQEQATQFRFRAIEAAVQFEMCISEILINLLSTEQTEEIIRKSLFSDATTFDRKVTLFNAFFKKGLFPSISKDSFIPSDLDYIKNLRNHMAHSSIKTSEEDINEHNGREVKFISFKERGDKHIIFKLYDMEDSPEKGIYSYNAMVNRYNRTSDSLVKYISEFQAKK